METDGYIKENMYHFRAFFEFTKPDGTKVRSSFSNTATIGTPDFSSADGTETGGDKTDRKDCIIHNLLGFAPLGLCTCIWIIILLTLLIIVLILCILLRKKKQCSVCHAKTIKKAKFCPSCGHPFNGTPPVEQIPNN